MYKPIVKHSSNYYLLASLIKDVLSTISYIPEVLQELWNNEFYFEMTEEDVKLTLPKFAIKSNVDMKQVLQGLGLECIFESTDIVPKLVNDMRIDDISQQVKIKVDENETEAAALTEMCVAHGATSN